jgi:predicted DNA-binding transcriptional regulator YafY
VRLEVVRKALSASRRGVPLKALAERHGWSLRNLYRDIEVLEAAGYNVIHSDGRFRLENTEPGSDTATSPDERLALYLAREGAQGWKHTSLGRALERLWHRISATGSDQAALFPLESAPWITTRGWSAIDYSQHRQIVSTLEHATRDRRAIQTRYRALSTRQITSRVIEPGQLHWEAALESLYLIGWCRLRAAVRVFAAHRFLAVTVLDETCPPRSETRSQTALRAAFRVWRSEHVDKVRIWFSHEVAEEIRERTWFPGQRIESVDRGGLILSGEVAGLAEVERWVLGYGPFARALAPRELVQTVRGRVRDAWAAYRADAVGSLTVPDNGRP